MTRVCLVTTTITEPVVLRAWRALSPDLAMICAGDDGAPDAAIRAVCDEVGARYLSADEQRALDYECSELIGWHVVQRRNIATLEAIKSGADVILTVDTDNVPESPDYFDVLLSRLLAKPGWGRVTQNGDCFVNPGNVASPWYWKRGFPYGLRNQWYQDIAAWREPVRCGVWESLVVGDPDINATERLDRFPDVCGYDDDVIVNPRKDFAPLNSQATAYVRELAPLMAVWPGCFRYDDIFGGYFAQAVMRATDYHVGYGAPHVRQERHPHDLIRDLELELHGMRYTDAFCEYLRAVPVRTGRGYETVLDYARFVVDALADAPVEWRVPTDFLRAWFNDVERVL